MAKSSYMSFGEFLVSTGFSFHETNEREDIKSPEGKRCTRYRGILYTPSDYDPSDKCSNATVVARFPDIKVIKITYIFNDVLCEKIVFPKEVKGTKAMLQGTLHVRRDDITVGEIYTIRRTGIVAFSGWW